MLEFIVLKESKNLQEIFNKKRFSLFFLQDSFGYKIDLSNNAKGVYFVTVTSENGVSTHKVNVQ